MLDSIMIEYSVCLLNCSKESPKNNKTNILKKIINTKHVLQKKVKVTNYTYILACKVNCLAQPEHINPWRDQ